MSDVDTVDSLRHEREVLLGKIALLRAKVAALRATPIPVWSNELLCHWQSWTVEGPTVLRVDLPETHCTDMTGAIALAERLMPDVTEIRTVSGGVPETRYTRTKRGAKWRAHRQA